LGVRTRKNKQEFWTPHLGVNLASVTVIYRQHLNGIIHSSDDGGQSHWHQEGGSIGVHLTCEQVLAGIWPGEGHVVGLHVVAHLGILRIDVFARYKGSGETKLDEASFNNMREDGLLFHSDRLSKDNLKHWHLPLSVDNRDFAFQVKDIHVQMLLREHVAGWVQALSVNWLTDESLEEPEWILNLVLTKS